MARTRAALALLAAAAVALALVSGGSSSDARTPPALPGLSPPFQTAAALGDGGLGAGLDAYGDVVDLRPAPAGRPLIADPLARQRAGTVPAATGIVPHASIAGGPPRPLWQAEAVEQRFLPGTNTLRTVADFGGGARAWTECAAHGAELGCTAGGSAGVRVEFERHDAAGGRVLLGRSARPLLAAAAAADRRWLARSLPLGGGAPGWARRLYRRSLLVLRALGGPGGALAAGAREGWAYVWPRDAGAAAIALAAAGQRGEARRIARFLAALDLGAAARFDAGGRPVPGRAAQGDASGWAAAAAGAAGLPAAEVTRLKRWARRSWRQRADYQEKAPGEYLANAIASGAPLGQFVTGRGLTREAGDPGSGLDSAAAWAVRPFPHPTLFPAARVTLDRLVARGGRFGIVPSEDWQGGSEPWTAPTAWSAWALATLGQRHRALALLGDLRRDETPAGLLPERVGARTGLPLSTTPLAWSHAFAILALRQLWPTGTRQRESQ